jgi:hypothetical protein
LFQKKGKENSKQPPTLTRPCFKNNKNLPTTINSGPLPQILAKITPLAAFLDTTETLVAIEDKGNQQPPAHHGPGSRPEGTNTHEM